MNNRYYKDGVPKHLSKKKQYRGSSENFQKLKITRKQKSVSIPITTRGVGLTLSMLSEKLSSNSEAQVPVNSLYRITLLQLETKYFEAANRQRTGSDRKKSIDSTIPQHITNQIKNIRVNLHPLSLIINSIGNFTHRGNRYYPRLISSHISPIISNLRNHVVRMSLLTTPMEERLESYRYNSIPGAIWKIDSLGALLTNPDDIIAADYTKQITNDIDAVLNFFTQIGKSMPELPSPVVYGETGAASQLVSIDITDNSLQCFATKDNNDQVQYILEGDESGFYSSAHINDKDIKIGILSLFGETTKVQSVGLAARNPDCTVITFDEPWYTVASALI